MYHTRSHMQLNTQLMNINSISVCYLSKLFSLLILIKMINEKYGQIDYACNNIFTPYSI